MEKVIKHMENEFAQAVDIIYLAQQNEIEIILDNGQLQLRYADDRSIDTNLLQQIKDNKQLIIEYLSNNNWQSKKVIKNFNKINKFDRELIKLIPLSFGQERLWFIDQLEGSVQYHIPIVFRLKGNLNKEALIHALKTLINRHEILRTVFLQQEGQTYQSIKDIEDWHLEMIDGSMYIQNQEGLQKYIRELIREPFDLSKDYMLRSSLITLSDQEHLLVIMLHHIASDGWSTSIILKEVVELYTAYIENRSAQLTPLEIQYADYTIWQRNYMQGEILRKGVDYWKQKLEGVAALQLPTDYQRPSVWSTVGASTDFKIEKGLSEQLLQLSHQEGTTLFITLLTAFKVLLYRHSGQQDICVGSPIADRAQEEVAGLIGFFVNTLAIRSEVNSEHSFTELLQQVRATTMEAYEHQDVPFEKVVEVVVKERDISRNPMFQVFFVLQNHLTFSDLRLGEVDLLLQQYEQTTTQFDILFNISNTTNCLRGSVKYATNLYNETTIRRMIDHYKTLLNSIIKNPEQKIGELDMLTQTEKQQLFVAFNNTTAEYPKDKTIVDLFEEQAAKTPRATAVVFKEEELTYKQLNERANQLGHYLRSKGVNKETLVPICIERSQEMIIGILGILKAGGAYVPVDPDYPQDRINFILTDTRAVILVTNKNKLQNPESVEIIELQTDWKTISTQPIENLQTDIQPHNLAYIIYTSGSTGKPKGVMIEHTSIVNYLLNSKCKYIGEKEGGSGSFINLSYTFDASLTAMFMPLLSGKSIILGSKQALDVFEDSNLQKYAPYDFIKITPSHLELLRSTVEEINGNWLTKKLVIGGEALHPGQFDYLVENGVDIEIINEYGPTEATVGCSTYSFQTLDDNEKLNNNISIGKPIDNVQIYILNDQNGLMPIGVLGELCIGGAGVARGYLNSPGLTAEKFIQNPFSKVPGARIYKTGDLARWQSDGNIEYLGRKDDQVKINGYRIELGEIENVLQQCELVHQAVVLAKEDKIGTKRLVGYIVPKKEFNRAGILDFLRSKLPEYMLPSMMVELQNFPLTINGKINRAALTDPDTIELSDKEYKAPQNDVEKKLVAIWQELLDIEKIGIHDDFFELGGHSLLAIRLSSYIERSLLVAIPLNVLFEFTTISALSKYLRIQESINDEGENKTLFKLIDV